MGLTKIKIQKAFKDNNLGEVEVNQIPTTKGDATLYATKDKHYIVVVSSITCRLIYKRKEVISCNVKDIDKIVNKINTVTSL